MNASQFSELIGHIVIDLHERNLVNSPLVVKAVEELNAQKLLKRRGFLFTENNLRQVIDAIVGLANASKELPGAHDLAAVLNSLGDVQDGGRLQYDHPIAATTTETAADPRLSIPHRDKWPQIDTKLKWIHATKTTKIYANDQVAWNELGAYLQAHPELRGSATDAKNMKADGGVPIDDENAIRGFSEKTANAVLNEPTKPGFTKVQRTYPAHVAECLALVDAMRYVGSAHTSIGPREMLAKTKTRIRRQILEQAATLAPEKLKVFTEGEIRTAESSSIR